MDDPLTEAGRIVDAEYPREIGRALAAFRSELALCEAIDVDEACDYGQEFLAQLLAHWLPQTEAE